MTYISDMMERVAKPTDKPKPKPSTKNEEQTSTVSELIARFEVEYHPA